MLCAQTPAAPEPLVHTDALTLTVTSPPSPALLCRPPDAVLPATLRARMPVALSPAVASVPELVTTTRPLLPLLTLPLPPILCATIPFAATPEVVIAAPASLVTVTVLPSPPSLPKPPSTRLVRIVSLPGTELVDPSVPTPPPKLCAKMPFERAPVVRMMPLFLTFTFPPPPAPPVPLLIVKVDRV